MPADPSQPPEGRAMPPERVLIQGIFEPATAETRWLQLRCSLCGKLVHRRGLSAHGLAHERRKEVIARALDWRSGYTFHPTVRP